MKRRITLGVAIGLGLGSISVLLLLWWVGLANGDDWVVRVEWNRYGEAWVEGVLLHISVVFILVVLGLTPRWLK